MEDTKKRGHTVGFWCCCVLMMLPMYVLSIGPTNYFYRKMDGKPTAGWAAIRTGYAPIKFVYEKGPRSVRAPLEKYMDWWERLALP